MNNLSETLQNCNIPIIILIEVFILDELRKFIDVSDIKISYYEKGIGETVILLHGNGMESRYLSKMFEKLAEKFNVIAIDIRAQGFSTAGEKSFSVELFADDILEFCEKKNIKKASFVGYSDGANIALWIAKKRKEIINKLVLISGNYKEEGLYSWFIIFLEVYKIVLGIASKGINKLKKRYELVDVMLGDIGITEEDLKNMEMKTLILCAGIEVVHIDHTKRLHKYIKNSTLHVIKRCSHVDICKRSKTIKEIYVFLSE